jgi:hypothetical protein
MLRTTLANPTALTMLKLDMAAHRIRRVHDKLLPTDRFN